ncbi:MAG: hypothetical protein ACXVFR_00175 [Nocardioidaceae bacterium]
MTQTSGPEPGYGTIVVMRSLLAWLAMLAAGLLGSVALTAYLLHQTVLNPDRPGQVLSAALDQPRLRHEILHDVVPGYQSIPAAQRHEINHALAGRRLQAAVRDVHVDGNGTIRLGPLRHQIGHTLRAHGQPQLARVVSDAAGGYTFHLPSLIGSRYAAGRRLAADVALKAGLAAAALYLLAFVVAPDRRRALRRIGIAVLLSCGGTLALYWLLPAAASAATHDVWVDAAATATRAFGSAIVTGLLPVAAGGLVLIGASFLIPRRPASRR